MRIYHTAVLAALLLALIPSAANALELGISDTWTPIEQRNQWAAQSNATWERIIVNVGQDDAATRIREIHAAGRKVILTVGGIGTQTRKPSFTAALRYIQMLPRADRYTISNEPDIEGIDACVYRKGWMKARRQLGRALLFGDLSPHWAVTFTLRVKACGPLPTKLDVAIHPYQPDDPFAATSYKPWAEGAMGSLGHAHRAFMRAGMRVSWWLTEFGYKAQISDEQAAWLWPRALQRAKAIGARVLVIYTCKSETWDTRPREQAWAAIRTHA